MPKPIALTDPSLYFNRELSTLAFNERVLAQAKDQSVPLLERLFFLSISCSNLDEFFEVRVASVMQQVKKPTRPSPDGMEPANLLSLIHQECNALVRDQYDYWNKHLLPELMGAGIHLLPRAKWTAEQRRWLKNHFDKEIAPVLSPLGLDPSHPFPRILNKSLNIVVQLEGKDAFGREGHMAVVRAPRSLPRVIQLPRKRNSKASHFVLLSSLLYEFSESLFPGMTVIGSHQFRVTRSSELSFDDDELENLAHTVQGELKDRDYANAVRLEVDFSCPDEIVEQLIRNFDLSEDAVYRCEGPVNLNRVAAIRGMVNRPDLVHAPFTPRIFPNMQGSEAFDVIREGDVMLHHPYDSFAPVTDLIKTASKDPKVLAIKQTLYRTSTDSSIVRHLCDAAQNGKDVTVVVELLARFDEQSNIKLANELQEAGVQVVYGVMGYKTHSKMLLIIRREGKKLQHYTHLSTGNYHSGTAKAYTDVGLITARKDIGEDVNKMFQQLSGLAPDIRLKHLVQSPFTMKREMLRLIADEANHAKAGKTARIMARMNALNEPDIIAALYAASQAGVEIDLIIRGHCLLRPGVPGVSENIRVRSVIGRFLEHTRAYWFANDGKPVMYASSADWMGRNLNRRVEAAFPFLDKKIFKRVVEETLTNYLADNVGAWILNADGTYTKPEAQPNVIHHNAQEALMAKISL